MEDSVPPKSFSAPCHGCHSLSPVHTVVAKQPKPVDLAAVWENFERVAIVLPRLDLKILFRMPCLRPQIPSGGSFQPIYDSCPWRHTSGRGGGSFGIVDD